MRIQVENSELGIITSFLITLGLVSLLSGQMYYIQSMQDGNGFGIGRVAIPFFFVAVFVYFFFCHRSKKIISNRYNLSELTDRDLL